MPPSRRIDAAVFLGCWIAFAWFHQGGGWSQNARFAMVRAIVERGTVAIDSHLIYRAGEKPGRLVRVPIERGRVTVDGREVALAWERGATVSGEPAGTARAVPVRALGASGDLVYARGHFHPNKAPGTALLAVPAYAAAYAGMRALGIDPDSPRALSVSAWIAGALSVALLSALAAVLFRRIALDYAGGNEGIALLATATFVFGTMVFPYATMLYDHGVVAAALVIAFYALRRARDGGAAWAALAGAAAGWAAISNYVTAVVVVIFGVYVLATVKGGRPRLAYGAGILLPFVAICVYNLACFGTPFTTNYAEQNPMFKTAGAWLGVFVSPKAGVLAAITFSPFRGLFVTSPVLLAACWGLARLFRVPRLRADAWTIASILAFYLLFTSGFDAWIGGSGVGPRYLVPALPFLCLGLPLALERIPKLTAALAAVSIALNLAVTAVDPQAPVIAAPGRPLWRSSPLTEYVLPLFFTARPGPLVDVDVRQSLPATKVRGPVSVNPIGMYEGWYYTRFPADSSEAKGSSFNLGEIVFPGSRWSLVPLLLLSPGLFLYALRLSSRRTPGRT